MIDPREQDLPEGVLELLATLRENSDTLQFRVVESSPGVFEIEGFYSACCFCGMPVQQRERGLVYTQPPRIDAVHTIMPRICNECGDRARSDGGVTSGQA